MFNVINHDKYFLPYQQKFIHDESPIIFVAKSRRVGITYATQFKSVLWCLKDGAKGKKEKKVHFSSADFSATLEFIEGCAHWLKMFNQVFEESYEVIDEKKGITAKVLRLNNGYKIYGHSSNPKNFRSKGGFVILDEFAFHDNQEELWRAAQPSAMVWGYPVIIISSINGKENLFYKFLKKIQNKKLDWSLHFITIHAATAEGLADKILGKTLTEKERQEWLDKLRESCADESVWLQEYCCIALDESTALLSYSSIEAIENHHLEPARTPIEVKSFRLKNKIYLGIDIARKGHMTIIWGLEKVGDRFITRIFRELHDTKFDDQEKIIKEFLELKAVRRCAIDATGIGAHISENLKTKEKYREFRYKVEPVTFTNGIKEKMAFNLKRKVQDQNIEIPFAHHIREDLHSIRQTVTNSNNIRLDAKEMSMKDESGKNIKRHGDIFWAAALAIEAGDGTEREPVPDIRTGKKRRASKLSKLLDYLRPDKFLSAIRYILSNGDIADAWCSWILKIFKHFLNTTLFIKEWLIFLFWAKHCQNIQISN